MEMGWLLQRIGVKSSKPTIKLKEGLNKVGRNLEGNTQVKLPSKWISRFHCDITVNEGYIFIKDLGSCNGSYVNSIRLDKDRLTELKSGDLISLGRNYQKDEEPLDSNHYVFKVVSCDSLKELHRLENVGAIKRKSSASPDTDHFNNNASKRFREASPVTSPQRLWGDLDDEVRSCLEAQESETGIKMAATIDAPLRKSPNSCTSSIDSSILMDSSVEVTSTSSVKSPTAFIDLTSDDPPQVAPSPQPTPHTLPPQSTLSSPPIPSPPPLQKENSPMKNTKLNHEISGYIDLTEPDPKSPAPLVEDASFAHSTLLNNGEDNKIFSKKILDAVSVLEVLNKLPPDQLEVVRDALKLQSIIHSNNGVIQNETRVSLFQNLPMETNSENIFKKPLTPKDISASNTSSNSLHCLSPSIQESVCTSSKSSTTCEDTSNNEISSSNDDVLSRCDEQKASDTLNTSCDLKINSIVCLNDMSLQNENFVSKNMENASSCGALEIPPQSVEIIDESSSNSTNIVRLNTSVVVPIESEISNDEINTRKKRRLGGDINDLKLDLFNPDNVKINLSSSSSLEINNSVQNNGVENSVKENIESPNIKRSVGNSEEIKTVTQKEQKCRRKSSDSKCLKSSELKIVSRRKSLEDNSSSKKFHTDKPPDRRKSVDNDSKVGGARIKSIEKQSNICPEASVSIKKNENIERKKTMANSQLISDKSAILKLNATPENNQNNPRKHTFRLVDTTDPALEKIWHDLESGSSSSMSESSTDHHFISNQLEKVFRPKNISKLEIGDPDSYNINDIENHILSLCYKPGDPKQNTEEITSKTDLSTNTSAHMCEIIDLDCDDVENISFSQEGVVEVDEGDTTYSSLFLDDFDIIDCTEKTDDMANVKPLFDCSRMIKEEAEEIHEEADIDLFESHFSQCSQELEDSLAYRSETIHKTETNEESFEGKSAVTSEEKCKPHSPIRCDPVNSGLATDVLKVIPSEQPLKITISRTSVSSNEDSNSCSSPQANLNEESKLALPQGLTGAKLVKSTLLSKPPAVGKRGRKKKTPVEPSITRDSIARRTREKINEERKTKLRDLALQKKTALENQKNALSVYNYRGHIDHDSKDSSTNSTKIAKITDRNRGSILLEGFLEKAEPRRSTRKPSNISETLLGKSSKPIILKSCLRTSISKTSTNRVSFSSSNEIREFECNGKLNKLNASTSKDKNPLLSQAVNIHQSLEVQSNEFIFNVVHWNTSWVNECKKVKGDPPICKDVCRSKDTYVSFNDYYRWLSPIILYELWGNVIKSMDERATNKSMLRFDGVILHKEPKRTDKRLLTLKCCVPLEAKAIPTLVDPLDNILVSTSASTDGRKMLLMFGIVDSQVRVTSVRGTSDPIVRNYLTNLSIKCDVCAYFDIVVHNSPNKTIEPGYLLKIRPTYNMMTEMRQYECLNRLQTSPLLWKIVDPEKDSCVQLPKNLEDTALISNFPLNKEQTIAVLGASYITESKKPSISLIHGPPGTGKTRVISAITEQIVHYNRKRGNGNIILICTQSNSAIDAICMRLLDVRKQLPREKRFRLTRFGKKERVHHRVVDILTSTLARNEIEKSNIDETLALEMEIFKAQERMIALSLETSSGESERNYKKKYEVIQTHIRQLEPILKKTASEEARRKQIDRLVSEEELKIINRTDIIATTLGSSTSRRILKALNDPSVQKDSEKRRIGVCIIDEATQATEADTLLPLIHGVTKLILVGDQQQLPPFVISETGKMNGLSCSLFARLHKVWSSVKPQDGLPSVPLFSLVIQHRMHPEIAHFPSATFYGGQLQTPDFLNVNRGYKPYTVFTHQHLQDPDSETNPKEGELLLKILHEIVESHLFKSLSIGIIVPYQKQRAIILELVRARKYHRLVDVNTIDSYQGQERDVIILSTVRTQGLGFLSDFQRTNVAITRAKRALYILGNFSSLQGETTWKNLLLDAQKRGIHFELPNNCRSSEIIDFLSNDKKRKRPTK